MIYTTDVNRRFKKMAMLSIETIDRMRASIINEYTGDKQIHAEELFDYFFCGQSRNDIEPHVMRLDIALMYIGKIRTILN